MSMDSDSLKSALGLLVELGACSEGVAWSSQYDVDKDRAWSECARGDWLLWFAGKLSGSSDGPARRKVVLCACECARLALPFVQPGDDHPRQAIELAERWAGGEGVTVEMMQACGSIQRFADSAAAVVASVNAKVSYSSHAAAAAAYAANATALVPQAASYAASAAAYAADAATRPSVPGSPAPVTEADGAVGNARRQMRALCREIVRRHYPRALAPGAILNFWIAKLLRREKDPLESKHPSTAWTSSLQTTIQTYHEPPEPPEPRNPGIPGIPGIPGRGGIAAILAAWAAARRSHRSFSGWPAWPFTHRVVTACG